jgi:hypothetical protein
MAYAEICRRERDLGEPGLYINAAMTESIGLPPLRRLLL